jgi:hypothetical protein
MTGITLLGIRVVVHGRRKSAGEPLGIQGNPRVLPVRVRGPVAIVKARPGEDPKVGAQVPQHRIEGLVLVQNKENVLDLPRRVAADGDDAPVHSLMEGKVVRQHAVVFRMGGEEIDLLQGAIDEVAVDPAEGNEPRGGRAALGGVGVGIDVLTHALGVRDI